MNDLLAIQMFRPYRPIPEEKPVPIRWTLEAGDEVTTFEGEGHVHMYVEAGGTYASCSVSGYGAWTRAAK